MPVTTTMLRIPAGEFLMGSDAFYPDEGPAHRVRVPAFELDQRPVTNAEFALFVAATGYLTVAERPLDPADFPDLSPQDLTPGALVFTPSPGPVDLSDWRQWWRWVPGASWQQPLGPGSSTAGGEDHPAVQVSYADAGAYAAWAGKRLPDEAEWEYAARGGLSDAFTYAWGNEPRPDGVLMANTWQGRFPYLHTGANGWKGTSPAGTFPPNGYGLSDMIGNVWEWTSSYYSTRHDTAAVAGTHDRAGGCACTPHQDKAAESAEPGSGIPRRVLKGGSHLCAPEYCLRYRPAARSPQAEDTATSHIGFRCARSLYNSVPKADTPIAVNDRS
ncbi:formylglycine-generating enzyme family protein [Arthrobacter sp. AL12]|uniref:formylglycine-generating enzyme family protein n=1 Tax=Arthrobacter sp. AL12 TaxID=3042241 RepID=UPI00249C5C55|nr:formylglycine-generating enzyme family protein [Arthrobacter sp. AL12]MDI3213061.1 formylglycine-generating enzyme family protein [Arthrobacter sp. AL12]